MKHGSRYLYRIWLVPVLALTGAVWWSYAQGTIQVGYTVVTRDGGTEMPVGTAVFSYRNGDGVLVTEAGVGVVEPVQRGRFIRRRSRNADSAGDGQHRRCVRSGHADPARR